MSGMIVGFKAWPGHYEREVSGVKPNTVRLQKATEIPHGIFRAIHEGEPCHIKITNTATGEHFIRTLTDASLVGVLLGYKIVVYSWRHEEQP